MTTNDRSLVTCELYQNFWILLQFNTVFCKKLTVQDSIFFYSLGTINNSELGFQIYYNKLFTPKETLYINKTLYFDMLKDISKFIEIN